jgi:hypothetical protein
MEARIDTDNEKFKVLRGTLICLMDIHKAKAVSTQEMKTKMDIHQEKMEAMIHSIWSELEQTIKHQVEDIL